MGCFQSTALDLRELLPKSPFFCIDNLSNISSLSKRFTKISYSANEVLWNKGDTNTSFNIIIEGKFIIL